MTHKNLAIAAILLGIAPFALGAAAEGETTAAASPDASPDAGSKLAAKAAAANALDPQIRASANWQTVFAEPGRRVEIDHASIARMPDGKIQAFGRIVFDRPLPDAASGSTYQILEAHNAYDCDKRTFATFQRLYRKDEKSLLRDEKNLRQRELPVRSGTLDEKILRAACRPGASEDKANFAATVMQAKAVANEGSGEYRKELLRNDLGGAAKAGAPKTPFAASAPAPAKAVKKSAAKTVPAVIAPPGNIPWAYEGRGGPEHWGSLDPDNKLCDSGQRQSPIDIRDGIRVDLPPINFHYRPSLFRIIDTGNTVQAAVGDNRISLIGKEYELIQFHFHRPGEERINGQSFDMTVHLVHKAYDGKLAIVAVPVKRGSEHPVIQTLWNYLPLEPNVDVYPPGVAIDLNELLPEQRGYLTHMGSLTTPPCSEGVLWLVMQTPIQLSSEQIDIFARLYPNNVRPIQPANGRLIKETR